MDNLYFKKVLLVYLPVFLFGNIALFAGGSTEYCGKIQDSIFVDADNARYTVEIDQIIEGIDLSNLEIGVGYKLWITSSEAEPDCVFSLSKKHPKQSNSINGGKVLEFIASSNTETIYIQNKNCTSTESHFVDISISKKQDDLNNMLNMMGVMTDPGYSVEQLIEDVFIGGGCFEVSNIQAIGNSQGIGFFSNGTSSVNIDEGVILASGAIGNSAGPNTITSITSDFGDGSGDPDLNILSVGQVYDAVGIEFDFTPCRKYSSI